MAGLTRSKFSKLVIYCWQRNLISSDQCKSYLDGFITRKVFDNLNNLKKKAVQYGEEINS